MPTYVITDDTKSLCLAISGGETKNIDKDNAVVRVIPANTGLNTTAIDQLSIEHDGHFATRIPYNDVTVSGVSPSSVLDFRTKVLTILNNNSSGGGDMTAAVYDPAGYAAQVTVVDIQRTINQAQALLASSGAAITAGQGYIIDNGGVLQLPTGISLMRVRGINLPAGAKGFDPNAEAYITALSTYVPCTYDVGTNTISGKYVIWAGNISQSSGADATIDYTSVNLLGETPVFNAQGSGQIFIENTVFSFPQHKTILFSPHVFLAPNLYSPSLTWNSGHELLLEMVKGDGTPADDIYNNTYIEISILF